MKENHQCVIKEKRQLSVQLLNNDTKTSTSSIMTFIWNQNNLTKLGGELLGLRLLQLVDASCGFGSHESTSPVTTDLEISING